MRLSISVLCGLITANGQFPGQERFNRTCDAVGSAHQCEIALQRKRFLNAEQRYTV